MSQDYDDSSALARYGVSDELIGMFESLRETPGRAGNKFRLEDVNAVAQSIVCRNYGKACLELSYLLSAVLQRFPPNLDPKRNFSPLLDFFWINESITPRRFRQAFDSPLTNGNIQLQIGKEFLQIAYGSSEFAISPTRVGYLAALFEFLVNVSPRIIKTAETQLAKPDVKSIKSFASDLQKLCYDYLGKQMEPAQQQRRFHFLSQWLKDKSPGVMLKDSINDETVLAFWQQVALDEDDKLGFKLYRTVATNFISLLQALHIGTSKRESDFAMTIGYDADGGEMHPEHLDSLLGASDDDIDIGWLAETPKFVTKQQLLLLTSIYSATHALGKLPLSVARMWLFGNWQSELVQATRNGGPSVIKTKLNKTFDGLYAQFQQDIENLNTTLAAVRLAVWHIFIELKQDSALQTMAQLLPEAAWSDVEQLLSTLQNQVSGGDEEALTAQINQAFFEKLAQYRLQLPELNHLLQQAKKTYSANNKQGFKQLPEVDNLSVYEYGFETLGRCCGVLEHYHQDLCQLFSPAAVEVDKSRSDLVIFTDMFKKLYEVGYE